MVADKQSRMLFVKNLSYSTKGEDLYELFGPYGAIRQIRIGNTQQTRGTAYIVFEEMGDAKRALTSLNVLYHDPGKLSGRGTLSQREEELLRAKQQYGMTD
ncbi:hypothetical protein CBS14141_001793 [Malassezia furfur]|nr:hypothetical protein CBS14141_001793 [Malassezia furfur]